jgi:hypothetical protein
MTQPASSASAAWNDRTLPGARSRPSRRSAWLVAGGDDDAARMNATVLKRATTKRADNNTVLRGTR